MESANATRIRLPLCLVTLLLLLAVVACRSTNEPKAPSWSKAKILADKEDHPSKIVSNGEAVYFVTGGTVASMNAGSNNIKRISLADGSTTVLVTGGKQIPTGTLALDDKYLYWSDGGNIFRVLKTGGTSEKIVPNSAQPDEMALDNENIFWLLWAGEGSPPLPIMYAPRNGGERKQLTPPQPPTSGFCLDGDFLYFMTGDGIKQVPKRGGEIVDFYRNPGKQPTLGLRQDGDHFYFCQMNERGHSALMKLNKKSRQVTQLAPSINHTMDFVVDEANVYYFDDVPKSGSFGPVALRKILKAGGEPVEIDQGSAGWVRHLAVDSRQIYFTDISKVYAISK
jgi:hypothetical protein